MKYRVIFVFISLQKWQWWISDSYKRLTQDEQGRCRILHGGWFLGTTFREGTTFRDIWRERGAPGTLHLYWDAQRVVLMDAYYMYSSECDDSLVCARIRCSGHPMAVRAWWI